MYFSEQIVLLFSGKATHEGVGERVLIELSIVVDELSSLSSHFSASRSSVGSMPSLA